MKNTIVLILVLVISSCKSINENHKIISNVINEKKIDDICDSIDVKRTFLEFNKYFFEKYKEEENDYNKGIRSTSNIILWKDNTKKWILSENEIIEMRNYSKKRNHINVSRLQKTDFIINLKSETEYLDEVEKNKQVSKRIKNCNYLVQFSNPVFNKNKTKAVIMEREVLLNETIYYILVKENNNWKIIGYTAISSE